MIKIVNSSSVPNLCSQLKYLPVCICLAQLCRLSSAATQSDFYATLCAKITINIGSR